MGGREVCPQPEGLFPSCCEVRGTREQPRAVQSVLRRSIFYPVTSDSPMHLRGTVASARMLIDKSKVGRRINVTESTDNKLLGVLEVAMEYTYLALTCHIYCILQFVNVIYCGMWSSQREAQALYGDWNAATAAANAATARESRRLLSLRLSSNTTTKSWVPQSGSCLTGTLC